MKYQQKKLWIKLLNKINNGGEKLTLALIVKEYWKFIKNNNIYSTSGQTTSSTGPFASGLLNSIIKHPLKVWIKLLNKINNNGGQKLGFAQIVKEY